MTTYIPLPGSWMQAILAQAPQPAEEPTMQADYQPYIFWAYACVCILLLAFTIFSLVQTKTLGSRVRFLEERFKSAHPEAENDS